MKTLIFSVFDSAVGAYMQPFFAPSKGAAIRSFTDACENKDAPFNKHKADFTLFFIGSFQDGDGVLSFAVNGPEKIISALEVSSLSSEQ